MFVRPSAFEYLLFDIDKWESLSKVEKVRVSLYFLKNRDHSADRDWESVCSIVQEFERYMGIAKIVHIRS